MGDTETSWLELSTSDRLRKVADCIEASQETATPHDQTDWVHPCGTPSCVAGWAVHLDPRYEIKDWNPVEIGGKVASKWVTAGSHSLGIDQSFGCPFFHSKCETHEMVERLHELAAEAGTDDADWVTDGR